MKVLSATGGIVSTNAYLVVDEPSGECVLFDAPDHTAGLLLDQVRANGWTLVGLWLTHGHFDHVADHQVVRAAFPDVKVLIHPLDGPKLNDPTPRTFQLPFVIPPGRADGPLHDGDVLRFGGTSCRVLATPGHSPGHVAFYFEQDRTLIGGDLIIGGAVGRYDFPDASLDRLIESVRLVMRLPPETTLLPGHGPPSTLGGELASNAYVRQIVEAAAG